MDFLPLGTGMRPDKRLPAPPQPSFAEALHFWFKLGWISFGGVAAHIATCCLFIIPPLNVVTVILRRGL